LHVKEAFCLVEIEDLEKDQLRLKTNLGYRIEAHPYGYRPRCELKAKRFKDLRGKDN
jgi:phenylacetate-CoA ligase